MKNELTPLSDTVVLKVLVQLHLHHHHHHHTVPCAKIKCQGPHVTPTQPHELGSGPTLSCVSNLKCRVMASRALHRWQCWGPNLAHIARGWAPLF